MFTHRPAFKFSILLTAGIIIGSGWTFPLQAAVILLALSMVMFLVIYLAGRSGHSGHSGKSSLLAGSLLALMIVLLGIVRITYDDKFDPGDTITHFAGQSDSVCLTGRITDPPAVRHETARFVVEAESVRIERRTYSASGGVVVSVKMKLLRDSVLACLTYGRSVSLRGELTEPEVIRNPGEFDYKRYLSLNGIYARMRVTSVDSTMLGPPDQNTFLGSCVYPVRRSIARHIDSLFRGEVASFLNGLLIGERSDISPELKTAFVNSGLMHILAVSGLHVAIVVLILMVIFQSLRVPELPRTIAIMLLLVYYIFLTGTAASVARSVVMATIFLGAKAFELKSDMYNTIACSAVVILLIDARQLFQAGFQLSFMAVISLVYLYPKIHMMHRFLPSRLAANRAISLLIDGLAVSIAAGIGTLPFTSYYFGKISIVSVVANVVMVPLSNVILGLGMITVGISYCSGWLGEIYAEATNILTWILLKGVRWFGTLSWAYIDSRGTIFSSIIFYGVVGLLANVHIRACRKILTIATLLSLNALVYYQIFAAPAPGTLRVTAIDVGQGDALFLELPNGQTLLVDGGPRTAIIDAGARFVSPFLHFRETRKLNGVLLTHPHSDHLGGIPAVLRSFPVDTLYEAGSPLQGALCEEYVRVADSLHVPRKVLSAGDVIHLGENVRVYILHPSGTFIDQTQRINLNNQSLVAKITFGSTSVLLSGDAEMEAEQGMVDKFGSFLDAELLKSGHHGSKTSSTAAYLKAVAPKSVVISVGVRNKFKHPSPSVLQRYRELGLEIWRTDQAGAIVFESDGIHWSRVDWRSP